VTARSKRLCYTALFIFFFGLLSASPLLAHIFAPSLYELKETVTGTVTVRWKEPIVRPQGSVLRPVLPPDCEGVGKVAVKNVDTAAIATWELTCTGGLIGKTVSVENIETSKADVLLRVELSDGRSFRHILTAGAPSYIIPERESALSVIKGYLTLGFFHILDGFDHLLFIIGIVLIVRWRRMLFWTITSFTVGHSITLALATLGFVNVSQQITEAAIALSLYFLGIELIRSYRSKNTLMGSYPWIIAGLFGLLHGLGFAGALSEVGLPQTDIPLALFSFNIGIEAGQLLFLGVVVLIWAALKRLPFSWPAFVKYIPPYVIGSLAVLWFLERIGSII